MAEDNLSFHDWANSILFSSHLEDKLRKISLNHRVDFSFSPMNDVPAGPGRSELHLFSEKQLKFPKASQLYLKQNLAIAMHAFANHELLAIELMALAILILPHHTEQEKKWKLGIAQSLMEEQVHFQLYVDRLKSCGYDFGSFPLSGFFWQRASHFKNFSEYSAVMSLTLEAANLDFANYYQKIFLELGDQVSASILEKVLMDEIKHVKFGVSLLKKLKGDHSLFDYYQSLLPFPLTPARSKGIDFQPHLRKLCGLDNSFIDSIKNFDDQFAITKR